MRFVDNINLSSGKKYCYVIAASFHGIGRGESYASDQLCEALPLANAIKTADLFNGEIYPCPTTGIVNINGNETMNIYLLNAQEALVQRFENDSNYQITIAERGFIFYRLKKVINFLRGKLL